MTHYTFTIREWTRFGSGGKKPLVQGNVWVRSNIKQLIMDAYGPDEYVIDYFNFADFIPTKYYNYDNVLIFAKEDTYGNLIAMSIGPKT